MAPQPRLPLSVCIIAGNEAQRIRRALESVADWAGEIVVATDNSVTDGTGDIARSYGAKVICEPWQGHASHRNLAAEKATQPWLLALDADEAVSPALRDEIIHAVTVDPPQANSKYAAYSFPRCTFYCGRWIRHGDWYPDRKVRLWQRGRGLWQGSPHENLVVQGQIGHLRCELLHYSMDSLEHQTRKTITSTDYFIRQCEARGRKVSLADLAFRPWWRFVRGYFLRLGFLDGWQGYAIAWMTAFYTFLRYARVRESQLPKPVDPP
jgi:glycosyltransferase involved in cell wall biosynthesis